MHPTHDFIYVMDVVAGLMAALIFDQGNSEVINIGSNFVTSISDSARTIAEVMGV